MACLVAFVIVGPRIVDGEAPTVLVQGLSDDGMVSGSTTISVRTFDDGAGVGRVTMSVGSTSLPYVGRGLGHQWRLDSNTMPDGDYVLQVLAEDRSFQPNRVVVEVPIVLDNSGPEIEVSDKSLIARQGKTWALMLRFDEPASWVEVSTPDGVLPVFPMSKDLRTYRGLRGFWVEAELGDFPVQIRAKDRLGNLSERTVVVQVQKTNFVFGGLVRLPKRVQKLTTQTDKNQWQRTRRAEAYAVQISEQLWDGPFIVPTAGRWSSPFGRFRRYNNGQARHHLGADIANQEGTPVYAANNGRVTRSERQHSFGEVVILGHGQTVSSSYNHLVERAVVEGEYVEKGQLVGWMGTTGLSTGPHLHWGMECGGYAVDPEQWLTESFEPN
ncbi:MAG: M23 family metallopeptidase [Myxococcota bacterium]